MIHTARFIEDRVRECGPKIQNAGYLRRGYSEYAGVLHGHGAGKARGLRVASGKRASPAQVPAPPPQRSRSGSWLPGPELPSCTPRIRAEPPSSPSRSPCLSGQGSNARRQQQSRSSRGCSPAGSQVAASKRSEAAPGWRPLGTSTPRTATGQPLRCRGSLGLPSPEVHSASIAPPAAVRPPQSSFPLQN